MTYQERALLTRIEFLPPPPGAHVRQKHFDIDHIKRMKFFFNDREPETFNCSLHTVQQIQGDIQQFLDDVQGYVEGFEFKLENEERWEKLRGALEFLQMENCGGNWSSIVDEENQDKLQEQSEGNTDFKI